MTETNLKSCPFCGGKALQTYAGTGFIVKCLKCGVEQEYFDTKKDAIDAWNTRQVEDNTVKYQPTSYSCRACKNATDSEIKRLREALTLMVEFFDEDWQNPPKNYVYVMEKAKEVLKGGEE